MRLKRKKLATKSLNLVIKTDKRSKLDRETKNVFLKIEQRKKGVDKKGLMEYFNYKPTTLINKLQ